MRLLPFLLFFACGDQEGGGGAAAEGCDACGEGEYCINYLGGERDGEELCAAIPDACDGDDSCECRGEMYDGCEEPYYGVGCSDSFPPTLISCNP